MKNKRYRIYNYKKREYEKEYYRFLSRIRRIIETIFSKIENLG